MSSAFNERLSGHLPPLVYTDDSHQRASIIIASTVLLFAALLFVGPRIWVRQHPDHDLTSNAGRVATPSGSFLGLDDWLSVVATVLYIIHVALVLSACFQGLGNSASSMSTVEIQAIERLYYASNVFYVLALGISNVSVSWLMVRINASRAPMVTRSLRGILGLIVLWTIAMTFVVLFACPLGSLATLSIRECPSWYGKWIALGVGGSCFEIAVTGVAVWQVWDLNTPFKTKALVVSLFALRLLVIPLIAIQLASFQGRPFEDDATLNVTLFVCLSELVLSYNICSSNFSAFRRLTNDIRTDFGGFTVGARSLLPSSSKYKPSFNDNKLSAGAQREQEPEIVPIIVSDGRLEGN